MCQSVWIERTNRRPVAVCRRSPYQPLWTLDHRPVKATPRLTNREDLHIQGPRTIVKQKRTLFQLFQPNQFVEDTSRLEDMKFNKLYLKCIGQKYQSSQIETYQSLSFRKGISVNTEIFFVVFNNLIQIILSQLLQQGHCHLSHTLQTVQYQMSVSNVLLWDIFEIWDISKIQGDRGWLTFGERNRIPQRFQRVRVCKFLRQNLLFSMIAWNFAVFC